MPVYTLFGQGSTAGSTTDASNNETDGMQFSLSQSAQLTGIWYFSPPTATLLAGACAVFQVTGAGTGTVVAGSEQDAPSWSGAAGSGWVKASYASGPTLLASTKYKVCILLPTTAGTYRSFVHFYWTTGPGGSGLTSGIITAPNDAGADVGQDSFHQGGGLAYPASTFEATNFWIDVEVTTSSVPGQAQAAPDDKSYLKKLLYLT